MERFLREAAVDPKVRGIKMTLYRTVEPEPDHGCLIEAAENGKQVAVVVELKARFDEATNIRLAERMEEAGIHVTYGVVGLKTHCKVIMVVRQDYNGLRRYVHIGTGNYHAETARIYSDLGLFTCDEDARPGCHRTVQLPDHRLHPQAEIPEDLPGPPVAQEGAAGEDRPGDRPSMPKGGGV